MSPDPSAPYPEGGPKEEGRDILAFSKKLFISLKKINNFILLGYVKGPGE